MRKLRGLVTSLAVICGAATGAQAHLLTCEKTVNGATTVTIDTYPATLHYSLTILNADTVAASTVLSASDSLLTGFGFAFTPTPPFNIPIGGKVTSTFDLTVTYDECLRLADDDGLADLNIDNVFQAGWDRGIAYCSARVICAPPVCLGDQCADGGVTDGGAPDGGVIDGGEDGGQDGGLTDGGTEDGGCLPGEVCDGGASDGGEQDGGCLPGETCDGGTGDGGSDAGSGSGATRTIGFYKTHEVSLQDCLNQGPIDLGYVTITTLAQAEGIHWGSPSRFQDGTRRSTLDQDRFILARQTLGGICNYRLFGTVPSPADLLTEAVAALSGTQCSNILALETQVDAYNSSGDNNAFPAGFVPGPATPTAAKSIAVDPTSPSGLSCTP